MSALLEIILKCPSSRIFMSVIIFLLLTLLYINSVLNMLYIIVHTALLRRAGPHSCFHSTLLAGEEPQVPKCCWVKQPPLFLPVKYPLQWIYLKVAERESLVQHLLLFDIEAFPIALSSWLKQGSQCCLCMSYVMLLLLDDSVFCSPFATHLTHREKRIPYSSVSKFSSLFLLYYKFAVKFNHC